MFQINRKEYTHLIDALGELQAALETERETQQLMADGSEDNFKGAAGMAMRAGLKAFLNQGVYEKAYQQSKKMKESMELLLPLVNKLSRDADTLEQYLEVDVVVNPHMPLGVLYVPPGSDIFMLDESYANYVEQNCEDLVRRGKFLKTQMQEAIDECAGIIDCSEEQLAINEALKSVLRIENFQEAFQSYVAGVKMLDESLRMDFLSLVDAEDIECGKALQNVVYENSEEQKIVTRIREILGKPMEEWTDEDEKIIEENINIIKGEEFCEVKGLSGKGYQLLVELELGTNLSKYDYIKLDENGNISAIRNQDVGDGGTTIGVGIFVTENNVERIKMLESLGIDWKDTTQWVTIDTIEIAFSNVKAEYSGYVDNIIARHNLNVSQAQYDALYLLAYNRPILLTKNGAVDRLLKEGNNNYSEWKEAILNEYRQLPGWGEFGNGWTNRIEDLLEVYFYEDYERTH